MKHLSVIVYLTVAFLKWNGEKLKGVSQSSCGDEVHDADIENIRRHMCLRYIKHADLLATCTDWLLLPLFLMCDRLLD